MNAVEYLKAKGKMCDEISCLKCGLSRYENNKNLECFIFETQYHKQAVELVENWAKENPIKTYLSVLLERLPNAKLNEKGLPTSICPNMIFKAENGCRKGQFMTCLECWNREYKEED